MGEGKKGCGMAHIGRWVWQVVYVCSSVEFPPSRNVVGLPPDKSSRSRAEHCFCGSASIWVGIAEVGGAGMIRLRVGGAEMSETK